MVVDNGSSTIGGSSSGDGGGGGGGSSKQWPELYMIFQLKDYMKFFFNFFLN